MFMRAARYARKVIFFVSCLCLCLCPNGENKSEEGIQADCLDRLGLLAYAVEAGHRHRQARVRAGQVLEWLRRTTKTTTGLS